MFENDGSRMLSRVRRSNYARLLALVALAGFTSDAYAYLDPGTGSILIQGAIAAIAAGAFTVRNYWHRIKGFLIGKKEAVSIHEHASGEDAAGSKPDATEEIPKRASMSE